MIKTRTVLVLGSNGFLGSNLLCKLFDLGYDVTGGYHRDTLRLNKNIPQFKISEIIQNRVAFDWVFICTAFIPRNKLEESSPFLDEVNVGLTQKIVSAFPTSKIIFCSSVAVYYPDGETKVESTLTIPNNAYGKSKLDGENEVRRHDNYAIVRFSSLYGPTMYANTFLPRIINDALEKNRILIYGSGMRKQNYLHVDDAVNYLIAAANYNRNDIFLATAQSSYSNKEIGKFIEEIMNERLITFIGEDASPSFLYDNSHTRSRLSITSEHPIKEGIKQLIEWNLKQY